MIYILAIVSFLLGTLQFVFSGILDQVAASIGVSVSMAGQLITAFSLGSAIGTPILILLAMRLDRQRLLLLALGTVFTSTITTALFPDYRLLLISRAVLGMGFGTYMVSAYSIVARLSDKDRLARSLANLAMGTSLAMVLGVPASRLIAAHLEWKFIFWSIGFLLLIFIFILSRALPTIQGEEGIPINEQLNQLKKPKILAALAVSLFMFIGYSSVNTYIAPYLVNVWNMSDGKISLIFFIFGIAGLVGAKLGGQLSDRISPGRTLILGLFAQAIMLLIVTLIPQREILIIIFLTGWSLSAWTTGAILNVNLMTTAPAATGILLSLNSSFIQLGFAAGAGIGGLVISLASLKSIIVIGVLAAGVAALAGIFSFRKGRKITGSAGSAPGTGGGSCS